jgi:hypothetical protein
MSNLRVGVPHLEEDLYGWWPTMENTLLMDDNPTKSILKNFGNIIFPETWTGNRKDTFLVNELASYLRKLVHHP